MIEVRIRRSCERGVDIHNNGRHLVQHPKWGEYWADKEHQARIRPLEEEHRYGELAVLDEAWWEQNGSWPSPPEEIPCPDCDGTGWIEEWADLARLSEFGLVVQT